MNYPTSPEQIRMDVWDAANGVKTFSEVHQKYADFNEEFEFPIIQQGEISEN